MEDGKVIGPPAALERAVLFLIPPAARESVAGDLWEIYRGPWAYLGDALPVAFFVVLSQIRRGVNPPLLALQGLLLFMLCSGLMPAGDALGVTAAVLMAGLLVGAYQGSGRVSARRAIIEAVLLAGGAAELSGLMAAHLVQPDWSEAPYFTFLGPYLVPLFCLMRTVILRWNDRAMAGPPEVISAELLQRRYDELRRSMARRNGVEIAALIAAAIAVPRLGFAGPIYLAGALYLLLARGSAPYTARQGLAERRAIYQRQLIREHAMRCLSWWLWFAPVLLSLRGAFAARAGHLSLLSLMAAVLIGGYFVESLNRERRGRLQEEIGFLAVARE